jgi:hypothetical protein
LPTHQAQFERTKAAVRASLDEERFVRMLQLGKQFAQENSLRQTVAEALASC